MSLAFDDDTGIGNASRINYVAQTSATFYLDVGGFNGKTGGYSVQARTDDVADDISTSDFINVGEVRNARGDFSGDRDFFGIDLVAGQSYEFSVQAPVGFGRLFILNSAGVDIEGAFTDDTLMYTATSTGRYFVVVRGDVAADYTLFA